MIIATHTFTKTASSEFLPSFENLPENYKYVVTILKAYVKENAVEVIEYPDANTCQVTVYWPENSFDAFILVADSIIEQHFNVPYLQWVEEFKQIQASMGYTFTRTIENVPD